MLADSGESTLSTSGQRGYPPQEGLAVPPGGKMQRIHRDDRRDAWAVRLQSPYLLEQMFGGEDNAVLVHGFERLSITQRTSFAKSLVGHSSRLVLYVGPDWELWQKELEEASLGRFSDYKAPMESRVVIDSFPSGTVDPAIMRLANDAVFPGFHPRHFAVVSLGGDDAQRFALERRVAQAMRGEPLPRLDTSLSASAAGAAARAARGEVEHTYLLQAGRWRISGHVFDPYGRRVGINGVADVVHMSDRWMVDGRLGDSLNRFDVHPLERGAVATTWRSRSATLGSLEGFFVLVDDAIVSTFTSLDGKFRGSESFRQQDRRNYEVRGAAFAGPVLANGWSLRLIRDA